MLNTDCIDLKLLLNIQNVVMRICSENYEKY